MTTARTLMVGALLFVAVEAGVISLHWQEVRAQALIIHAWLWCQAPSPIDDLEIRNRRLGITNLSDDVQRDYVQAERCNGLTPELFRALPSRSRVIRIVPD
jgi:hypothetical protein